MFITVYFNHVIFMVWVALGSAIIFSDYLEIYQLRLKMEFVNEPTNVGESDISSKTGSAQSICENCKHYTPLNAEKGQCPIAGDRLACDSADTCPSKMFECDR